MRWPDEESAIDVLIVPNSKADLDMEDSNLRAVFDLDVKYVRPRLNTLPSDEVDNERDGE
jgi:hypothetical protein